MLSALALDIMESQTDGGGAGDSVGGIVVSSSTGATINSDTLGSIVNLYDNRTFKLASGPGDWSIEQCLLSWSRPHHLYFQLGNALFFIAFLAPHGSYGLLCSRCALVVGSILLTMWGYLIECTADVVVWSGSFIVINVIYLIVLLCRLRPVRFDKEIEAVSFVIIYNN